jgi:hypothetical protein
VLWKKVLKYDIEEKHMIDLHGMSELIAKANKKKQEKNPKKTTTHNSFLFYDCLNYKSAKPLANFSINIETVIKHYFFYFDRLPNFFLL